MKRGCFSLQVKKELLEEYLEVHQGAWPELIEAMRDVGIRNYSLFYRPDGLLIGYLEADNLDGIFQRLDEWKISRKWEAKMAKFFESDDLVSGQGGGLTWLQQYFFME